MTLERMAFLVFAAVALGGLLMGGLILAKRQVPRGLGPLHGLGGLAGAGLLLAANLGHAAAGERAWLALGVFTTLLVVGVLVFVVLFRHRAPLFLVAGHGSVALIGLYILYPLAFPAA